jgi:diaminopimelate decarboxylase
MFIIHEILQAGFGVDCVSGNEVAFALAQGFAAEHIAFAGVGKTDEEILLGLKHNIFSFNVESIEELSIINQIAEKQGQKANVALRINPNVNAKTHHYITTGVEENKFGINAWQFNDLVYLIRNLSHINVVGLHFHIGSQIVDMEVFKNLCVRVNEIQAWFKTQNLVFPHLNLGGGLGIDYHHPESQIPDFESFFRIFEHLIDKYPNQQVHFELGRSLVAQCGSLITKVLFVKQGLKKNFAIVDAGM